MVGGLRHPMPEVGLSCFLTKSDAKKSAKAVKPLRTWEKQALLCRYLASTLRA